MLQTIPHIGLLAASLRPNSINNNLVRATAIKFAAQGVKTSIVNLKDYPLPLFSSEIKIPKNVHSIAKRLASFDGIFIATPEHNGAPPALLKNLIDWISVAKSQAFCRPIYAIGAASPGPMSGIFAMQHLAFLLNRLGASLIPTQVGVGHGKSAFDNTGTFVDGISNDLADQMVAQMLVRIHERFCMAYYQQAYK